MRLVWVTASGNAAGGAEIACLEGLRALRAQGHAVRAIVPSAESLAARLRALAVPVDVVPYGSWLAPPGRQTAAARAQRWRQNVAAVPGLCATLARAGPDVVLTNTLLPPSAAFAARRLGLPHVWLIHEYGLEDHGWQFDLGAERSLALIARLSARVVTCSRALFEHFAPAIGAHKLRTVYCAAAVNQTALPPAGGGPLRLVLVGARLPSKGQHHAVYALALLARAGLDVHLTLVGPSAPRYDALLTQLAARHGVRDRLTLVDFTPAPHAYVAASDVALMCSRAEAFGRVTVEAMKVGRPVVGSAAGGTLELIRDEETGLLYRPGDAHHLAEQLARLYHDRDLLRRLGERAREWARATFTLDRYGADLAAVCAEARATGNTCGAGAGG